MAARGWPGLGPVFAYEWLMVSRRWQGYALRSLLVLLLLLGLAAVWLGSLDGSGEASFQRLAEIGRGFYVVTTLILLGLVGLAAPAGAICLDKARGNLTLLFSTHLTDVAGYLFGSYRIATASDSNSSRPMSFNTYELQSPGEKPNGKVKRTGRFTRPAAHPWPIL